MPSPKRRHLDIAEKKFLAQQLQVLALQGIMRSRRWSDSEIRFQGGAALIWCMTRAALAKTSTFW